MKSIAYISDTSVTGRFTAIFIWIVVMLLSYPMHIYAESDHQHPDSLPIPRYSAASLERVDADFRKQIASLSPSALFRLGDDQNLNSPEGINKALLCYVTATSLSDEYGKHPKEMRDIAKSYINIAYIYRTRFHNNYESYNNLKRAEQICSEYGLKDVLCHVYLSLSSVLSINSTLSAASNPATDHKSEDDYLEKAFSYALGSKNHEVAAFSIINMIAEYDVVDSRSIGGYIGKYLNGEIPDTTGIQRYARFLCQGVEAFINQDYNGAHTALQNAVATDVDKKYPKQQLNELALLYDALAYERAGDVRHSEQLLLSLLDSTRKREDAEWEMWMHGNLNLFYLRQKDSKQADTHLLAYYRMREKLAEEEGSSLSTDEYEMQNTISAYRRELEQAAEERRRVRLILISGGTIAVMVILLLCFLLYHAKKRRQYIMRLYEKNLLERADSTPGQSSEPGEDSPESGACNETSVPDPKLVEAITTVLDNGSEPFNNDFQLVTLCNMVGSNTTYVSQAINHHYGKPFKNVLAERRIREACRRLDDPVANSTLTIEAICLEVGFKSRSAFSVAFKSVTGLTPTEYRKAAKRYMPAS